MSLTVAGIGSYHGGDDGVGLRLVADLQDAVLPPGVTTALWADADALTLADSLLNGDGPTLIVDCAEMGLAGGSWRHFSSAEGRLTVRSRAISTHGLGLAEALAIARQLGHRHAVHFFGIQPFDIGLSPTLSAPMRARLPALQQGLIDTLDRLAQDATLRAT